MDSSFPATTSSSFADVKRRPPFPQFPLVPPHYNLMNADGLPNVPHTLKVMDHMYNGQFRKWVCDESNLASSGPIISRIANEGHDIPRIANAIKWMTSQWPLASTAALLKMIVANWALTVPESCHCSLHSQPLSASRCDESFFHSNTLPVHSDHSSVTELADKSCACCSCSSKLTEEHASYRRQLNRAGRLCGLLTASWEPHLISQICNAILEKWVCQYQRESFVMTLTHSWDFSRLSYFLISLGDRARLSHQVKVSLLRAAATGSSASLSAGTVQSCQEESSSSQSNKCAKRTSTSSPGSSSRHITVEPPELYHRTSSSMTLNMVASPEDTGDSPNLSNEPISFSVPRRTVTSAYIGRYPQYPSTSHQGRRQYTQDYSSSSQSQNASSSATTSALNTSIEIEMSSPTSTSSMMMMDLDTPLHLSRSMPRALPIPQPPSESATVSVPSTSTSSIPSLRSRSSQESLATSIDSSLPSGESKEVPWPSLVNQSTSNDPMDQA